mmetsp:Transcript_22000/g.37644  ORF Transcript_22000/g.37644 Transcript_22000/m.37644 type:complete len:180 (+) Transcript_22000:136-675(+)
MGQASSGLTQYDMEELIAAAGGVFNQAEVEGLYKRFRSLDRGRKGYISGDEFLQIPELSINPIAQRVVRVFESVNFKDYIRLVAPFSQRATREAKLAAMFYVYDVDGDGLIGREDLALMLRQLAGSSLSEEELHALVDMSMKEAGHEAAKIGGLNQTLFNRALEGVDLKGMTVEMPHEW